MTRNEVLPGLLEALYAGLTRDPPWEGFLDNLAVAAEASFATLIIATGRRGIEAVVTPGVDPVRFDEYERLADADPFVDLPEGKVISFQDFVTHVPSQFQDWMDSIAAAKILGVDLHAPSGGYCRLRLTRDQTLPEFRDRAKNLVSILVPHLRIALDLHARLTTTQAEGQVFSRAMAGLAVATLILAKDGRLMRCNAVAERLLQEQTVFAEWQGRLQPATQTGIVMLQRLLTSPPPQGEEMRFDLPTTNGHPLRVRALSLPTSAYGDGSFLALFVTDPATKGAPDRETLRDRFQLTPAEAALALQLANGVSLVDAARLLTITHNTARAHLRAIFAKTGTHRQAQLVHLIRSGTSDR